MRRMTRRTKAITVLSVLAVLVIASVATYLLWPGSESRNNNDDARSGREMTTQMLDTRATVYATQDSFVRYMQTAQSDEKIKQEYIHDAPTVEWNEQALVGVKFDIPVFQEYRTVGLEEVDGVKTVVIDVLDRSDNCMASPQVNYEHIAFVRIDQSETKDTYPVMIRVTPNEASCP